MAGSPRQLPHSLTAAAGGWACCLFCPGLLFLITLAFPAPAVAEDGPLLHIRARSRLELRQLEEQSRKGKFTVGVSVELSDQPQPSGEADAAAPEDAHWFSAQRVELLLSSEAGLVQRVSLSTDRLGVASHQFARLPSGLYHLRAQYAGDEHRDAAAAEIDLHLDRFRSDLDFSLPATWGGGGALLLSGLTLRSKQQSLPGPVSIAVFALRDGRESGAPLTQQLVRLAATSGSAVGEADDPAREDEPRRGLRGGESVKLQLPAIPAGSLLAVRAAFAGDLDHSPAQLQRETLVVAQAQITLEVAQPEVPQSGRLRISGTVFTSGPVGAGPLVGELVDIEAAQALDGPEPPAAPGLAETAPSPAAAATLRRALGTAVSNADGRFVLDLPRLPLRVGASDLIARVVPARRYIRPAVSNEVRLVVTPPEPVSLLYFLLPLFGSALLAGLVWLGRWLTPRITAWLALRRARRRAQQSLAAAGPASGEAAALSTSGISKIGLAGVSLGSRSSLSLRRTVDTTIDGAVHDAAFGQAIAGASISLTPLSPDPAAQQRATESDADGRFVLSQLRAGRCVLRIAAPGYQAQELVASVPHRGELRGITVRLLPLRVRLFAEWQRVAVAYYGEAGVVQTRTPQDFLQEAQRGPAGSAGRAGGLQTAVPAHVLPALRRLTTLVEEAYYSSRTCSDAMLQESERLAAGILPATPADKSTDGLRAEAGPRPVQ